MSDAEICKLHTSQAVKISQLFGGRAQGRKILTKVTSIHQL